MRLAMKLVVSFPKTMPLPSTSSPKRAMIAISRAGSVSSPATSSSSFM
jgi:hypothetical protein